MEEWASEGSSALNPLVSIVFQSPYVCTAVVNECMFWLSKTIQYNSKLKQKGEAAMNKGLQDNEG
jgi:hypothetical protein